MPLADEIRKHIVSTYLPGESPEALGPDDDLIDSGILDSLAMMQLVSHLEREYGITIPTGDIDPDHFASTRTLAAFVERQLASK